MKNSNVQSRSLKGICNSGDQAVEGMIILKYTLMEQGLNLWPLFIYFEFGDQRRVDVKMVTNLRLAVFTS